MSARRRRSHEGGGSQEGGAETEPPGAAAVAGDPPVEEAGRELMTLWLGDARFGVWIDEVLEVVRTPPISRLPLPVPEVAGVCAVRGDVVPVLDLGVRLLGTAAARPGRLVLVHHQGSGTVVGLLVDDLGTLLTVGEEELQEPPEGAEADFGEELTVGVVVREDAVVTVLDLERAAAPPANETEEKRKP